MAQIEAFAAANPTDKRVVRINNLSENMLTSLKAASAYGRAVGNLMRELEGR